MGKYATWIMCLGLVVLTLCGSANANPLKRFISLFQKDLYLNVYYTNHRNLIPGSKVYMADDPGGEKALVGKVSTVRIVPGKNGGAARSEVQIVIDGQYVDNIYTSTVFVLMSNPFFGSSDPFIVAVPSKDAPQDSGKKRLVSGTDVRGVTFLEYKIAAAGTDFKSIVDSVVSQNQKWMEQLSDYLKNLDTKAFQEKMDKMMDQVSRFSAEQKKTFKKEILPGVQKMYDAFIKKLDEQHDGKKSEELKKQLHKMEKLIDV